MVSCKSCCLSTTVVVVAVIVGAFLNAQTRMYIPLEPLPTDAELAAIGGAYFTRPTDGEKLEYFVRGDLSHKKAVVVYHGSSGTGWAWCGGFEGEKVDAVLARASAALVCVTFPGLGPSTPYSPEYTGVEAASAIANDTVALLTHLGVSDVYTVGISFGHEPAVKLASVVAGVEGMSVGGVTSVVGSPWGTYEHDPHEFSEDTSRLIIAAGKLLASPYIAPGMSLYVMGPMTKLAGEGADFCRALLPADDLNAFMQTHTESDLAIFGNDLLRGNRWYGTAMVLPARYFLFRDTHGYTDYSAIPPNTPIRYFYGSTDTNVTPRARQYFKSKLPQAELVEFEGGHVQVPFAAAVAATLGV